MKVHIALLFCTFFSATTMFAQLSATQVLDKTAARFGSSVTAAFSADNFSGDNKTGSTSGTIAIKGKKFVISTPGYKTWFDGKTQWTYTNANEEVNVSTPTADEVARMNPTSFVYLYKQGYSATVKDVTLRGKTCYEVHLKANQGKAIKEVILTIEKSSFTPYSIRFRQGSNQWTRITINNFTNQKTKDTAYAFNSKDYPQAEIIDLR
ncbi:MAG: LolA-like putative outer membrane lipoprotein chaperone [Bacteroidales bacterium]|nr:LolA-like putative outer membrane lipoprotein chaperone [Bacteroidales bacterium]